MECPRCKADIPDGGRFCDECGAPAPVVCRACGAPNRLGAKFCAACGGRLAAAGASTTAPAAPPSSPASSAERRQITVVFVDLVGSTAMSARLDPEDLRDVIGAYHRCVAEVVGGYDGFVAKYMGDGVLVYFGYPRAHEDDAERAVRAGLAVVEAVGALPAPAGGERLRARIGVATGLVVVGDLVGAGEARERGVVGETPNVAARLQAAAEPNAVIIAQGTRRLIGDLFECRDLGAITVKGIVEPVQAWEVLRASAVESRFEALHGSAPTPLVGREEEIELLLRRWQQAKGGEGQVVLLLGEPGIGKSRLTAVLQERIADEAHTRLRYFCSPYHTDSALYPFISQLERAAKFERDAPPETKLQHLETLLTASARNLPEDAALLAELLSIPTGDRYPALNFSPPQKKEKTLAALIAQLEGLAAYRPVLMLFEDAHWIDPTSRELLERTVDRVQSLPVLLLITFRPEFTPPWVGLPHVTLHPLNRLSRRHGAAMIERLTGGRPLPREVADQIIERTDGIPLFVEELTKTVLESGLLREQDGRYVLDGPLPPLAIPTSLHASLMARLDRLAPVKEVAQIGAAIGREFSYELVAAATHRSDAELQIALDQLTNAGMVFRRGIPPRATFLFKHALVQDAAYATLLRGPRQELHARIAKVLEERFPERAAVEPELVAHHFTAAGLAAPAIDYWLRAGAHAAERSANVEAVAHLGRGLELLAQLPPGPERARRELALRLAIGGPLIATRGYAAAETTEVYARARELCEELADDAQLLPVLYGEWAARYVRAEVPEMRALAARFGALSDRDGRSGMQLIASRMLALDRFHSGALIEARRLLETILMRYDPAQHQGLAFQFGHDVRAAPLCYLAWTLWALGYPDRASATSEAAIAWGKELTHANSKGIALCWGGAMPNVLLRRPAMAEARAQDLIRFCDEVRLPLWGAYGRVYLGWAMVEQGDLDVGRSLIARGLAELRGTGSRRFMPLLLCWAAEAEARVGRLDTAITTIGDAFAALDETADAIWTAELYRVRAGLVSCVGGSEVESDLRRALEVARQQQARSLELRATVSLARLWRDEGRRVGARDLLAPVYGWFTEGFDLPDLKDAKALLDEFSE